MKRQQKGSGNPNKTWDRLMSQTRFVEKLQSDTSLIRMDLLDSSNQLRIDQIKKYLLTVIQHKTNNI
jgi:hypothetical protein